MRHKIMNKRVVKNVLTFRIKYRMLVSSNLMDNKGRVRALFITSIARHSANLVWKVTCNFPTSRIKCAV